MEETQETQNERVSGIDNIDEITVPSMAKGESIKYACKQCAYQTKRQCDLKTHIQSIHEGFQHKHL